jgi:cytosine/adenosine deaminase-related metal-dependent hydrolase
MSIVQARPASSRPVLIKSGLVLTFDDSLGDMAEADILIKDGRIVDVGRSIIVEEAEVIDASDMIVMPGFVDGHRHLWETTLRHALPTEGLAGYIARINRGFARAFTAEDAYLGTLAGALACLDAGITTVMDWSHIQSSPDHTEGCISALEEAGIRAVFCYGHPPRTDLGAVWPDGLAALQNRHFASRDQLLTLALAGPSPEHVDDETAKRFFAMAREAGVIMTTHAGLKGIGKAGEIGRFAREGLLGPHVNLVHANSFSRDEWKLIADTGTSVCITPGVEMQQGHGVPPIQPARDAGCKPSIGVDVETSVPNDMWTQMRLIYGLQRMLAYQREHAGEAPAQLMTIDEVLECTISSGARSALLDHKIGSIAVGKQADIVLLRTDTFNVLHVADPRSAVVLNMDARNVDSVMVAGKMVKRGGRMLGVDLDGLRQRLLSSRDRIHLETDGKLPALAMGFTHATS